jgi:hypothetical protein
MRIVPALLGFWFPSVLYSHGCSDSFAMFTGFRNRVIEGLTEASNLEVPKLC